MSPRLLAIGTRLAGAGLSLGLGRVFEPSSAHIADELSARATPYATRRRATVCNVARCMRMNDGKGKGGNTDDTRRVECRARARPLSNARRQFSVHHHQSMGRLLGRIFVFLVVCLISFIAFSIQIWVIWPWYGNTLSVELIALLGPFK